MAHITVLHVITGTPIGGAEIMLFRYLRALGPIATAGHVVISMMPCGPTADMIRKLGIPVEELGVTGARDMPRAVARLRSRMRDIRPEVVHGWMYHGSLIATLARLSGGGRNSGLIWGIHHSLADPRRESRMTRAVLRLLRLLSGRVDAITYCSVQSQQQHESFGLPHDRGVFLPNALDLREFAPDPAARARLCAVAGIPPEREIIGSFARAHPMKDHEAFAACIAHLAARGRDVHGLLIGAGQSDGPALRLAQDMGLAERFTALPPRGDIAALVPGLDVYLLSSAWGEALPLAVAEAMAAGVPAVVTDVGDCGWLVGGCGHVCPPGQPEMLATAVARILNLPDTGRAALQARCRARIAHLLSMDDYVAHHDRLYDAAR
ncbi:MAG: glycosyltransferase, partial [Celeribacter sp.]